MNFEMRCDDVVNKLEKIRIMPVLALEKVDDGLRLCELLMKCGLPGAEVTFRTDAAVRIIAEAAKRFPEMLLGAGTVLRQRDLLFACDAGAQFAVAPGLNPLMLKTAIDNEIPFIPGINSPSGIEQAAELGCRVFKFFPAEASGGVKMLKAMTSPYRHCGYRYLPTGGINAANAADYLAIDEVVAVGGTWIADAQAIAAGEWDKIRAGINAAVKIVDSLR